jgi:hypothetical protein
MAAINTDGRVLPWGGYVYGGSFSYHSYTAGFDPAANLGTGASEIFSTAGAFAVLKTDGKVFAWGDSGYGGDVTQGCVDTGCTVDASSTLNTGTAVEKIYSNEFAFAAVYTTGQVITWGGQSQGGDMSSVVTDLDGTVGITAIYSTSTAFAALRTDGNVYCWGESTAGGSCVTATVCDSNSCTESLANIEYIVANDKAFAALNNNGKVLYWGDGAYTTSITAGAMQTGTKMIYANSYAFAAINSTNQLETWGDPTYGGDSSSFASSVTDAVSIGGSDEAFGVIQSDGTFFLWGPTTSGGDEYSPYYDASLQGTAAVIIGSGKWAANSGFATNQAGCDGGYNTLQEVNGAAYAALDTATPYTCTACPAGKYDAGWACRSCNMGTANGVTGVTQCPYCLVGQYADAMGATACTGCGAGKININAAATVATECKDCGAGTYSDAGEGVACTDCPLGTFSGEGDDEGVGACTACPAGEYADVVGTADQCTLCPLNEFAGGGADVCTACPGGRITPAEGATAEDECVSPEINFYTGFATIGIIFPIALEYIIHGRFHRIAFLRQERVTTPLIAECQAFATRVYYNVMKAKAEKEFKTSMKTSKTLIFLFGGIAVAFLVTLISFIGMMASIFFKAMIVWRGIGVNIDFYKLMDAAVKQLSFITNMKLFYYIFWPLEFMFNLFATFEIDLASVAITCQGASAPMELLINMIVLGLAVVIIESDYQLFRAISFKYLSDLFFEASLQPTYRKFITHRIGDTSGIALHRTWAGIIQYAKVTLGTFAVIQMTNFDLFQGFLQYLMSCLTLATFVADNGLHPYSPQCNNVDGYENFDTYIALASSIQAWMLFLPFFYEISKLLVPGLPNSATYVKARLAADAEERHDPKSSWMHLAKYTTFLNLDLYMAYFSEKWLRFMASNIRLETGRNRFSMMKQQRMDKEEYERIDDETFETGTVDVIINDEEGEVEESESEKKLEKEAMDEQTEENKKSCFACCAAPVDRRRKFSSKIQFEEVDMTVVEGDQEEIDLEDLLDFSVLTDPYKPQYRVTINTGVSIADKYLGCFYQNRAGYELQNTVWSALPFDESDNYIQQNQEVALMIIQRKTGMIKNVRVYDVDDGQPQVKPVFENVFTLKDLAHDLSMLHHDHDLFVLYTTKQPFQNVSWDAFKPVQEALLSKCPSAGISDLKGSDSYLLIGIPVLDEKEKAARKASATAPIASTDDDAGSEADMDESDCFERSSDVPFNIDIHFALTQTGFSKPVVHAGDADDFEVHGLSGREIHVSMKADNMDQFTHNNDKQATGGCIDFNKLYSKNLMYAPFRPRSEAENADWKDRRKVTMPSYYTLCRLEYLELRDNYEEPYNEYEEDEEGSETAEAGHRVAELSAGDADADTAAATLEGESSNVDSRKAGPTVYSEQPDASSETLDSHDGNVVRKSIIERRKSLASAHQADSHLSSGNVHKVEVDGEVHYFAGSRSHGRIRKITTCMRLLYCVCIFFGLGHVMTRVGRQGWHVVGKKYIGFILLCLGIWTEEMFETLSVHNIVDATTLVYKKPRNYHLPERYLKHRAHKRLPRNPDSLVYHLDGNGNIKEGDDVDAYGESSILRYLQEEELKRQYKVDTAETLYNIVATRGVILQVIPQLALLSIYASTMSASPLYIFPTDLRTHVPELVVNDAFGEMLFSEEQEIAQHHYIRKNVDLNQNNVANPSHKYVANKDLPPADRLTSIQKGLEGMWVERSDEEKQAVTNRNAKYQIALRKAVNPGIEISDTEEKLIRKAMQVNDKGGKFALQQKEIIQEPEEPDLWVVALGGIPLYFHESRAFNYLVNLFKYVLTLVIIFERDTATIRNWMVAAVCILIPYAFLAALEMNILIGTALDITDDDIIYVFNFIGLGDYWLSMVTWITKKKDKLPEVTLLTRMRDNGMLDWFKWCQRTCCWCCCVIEGVEYVPPMDQEELENNGLSQKEGNDDLRTDELVNDDGSKDIVFVNENDASVDTGASGGEAVVEMTSITPSAPVGKIGENATPPTGGEEE